MAKRATINRTAGSKHPLSRGVNFSDTLVNLMTGLGTEKDKLRGTVFGYNILAKDQLDNAYRGDWISRKIIDIPAYDSFREWRSWDVDTAEADLLISAEKTLFLQRKSMLAETRARLYGGAALILGIDQGVSSDEVDYNSLKQGCLKFVHCVSRYEIQAGPLNLDVLSPYFGEPQYYTMSTLNEGGVNATMQFHPSRVVRFVGQESADQRTNQGWGDSVLTIVADAVLSAGLVNGSIAQMVAEAKIDVMKIPGLANQISTSGYEQKLIKRVATMNMMKSTFNIAIVDSLETLERVATDFKTLPDIANFYMLMACGAADIPATRFLGQSPAGMSATGDSDTRNYYDARKTDQSLRIAPAMGRLDKVLMISATGTYDDKVTTTWNPLWQLSDAEKGLLAVQKATVFTTDVNTALLNDVVLKKAREAQLIADGTYPGLADIIEEFDDDPDLENQPAPPVAFGLPGDPLAPANENTPVDPNNAPDPKKGIDPSKGQANAGGVSEGKFGGRKVASADLKAVLGDKMLQPKPLYVYREVTNKDDIIKWAKSQGFDAVIDDLHVTIIYSKTAVDWLKAGEDSFGYNANKDGSLRVAPGGPRVMQLFGQGNVVVLAFASTDLSYRHSSIMCNVDNASWDHDDYTPHISITYNKPEAMNIDNVVPYGGAIELGPEIFETINPDYSEGLVENPT